MINRSNRITANTQWTARAAATCYNDRNLTTPRDVTTKDHKRELNHSRAGLEMILWHMESAAFSGRPEARYFKPTR